MLTGKLSYVFFLVSFLLPSLANSQIISIDGTVVNPKTGKNIVEVNIFDEISGIGTISDQAGHFRLILSPGKVKLTINDDTYKPFSMRFTATNDTLLTVKLTPKKDIKADTLVSKEKYLLTTANKAKKH